MLSIAATNYIEVNTTLPGPVHAWLLIVVFVAVTDDDMYVSLDATKYCIKSHLAVIVVSALVYLCIY